MIKVDLEDLFGEAKKNFPELRRADEGDVEPIRNFMQYVDRNGDFFYEKDRKYFIYDLFDGKYVSNLVKSSNDIISIIKGDSVKAFSHWGMEGSNLWNYYTVTSENGKGLGKRIYEAFLEHINKSKNNFITEFVSTSAMAKIYKIWERHETLPMGFLCSKYENSKGDIFSSVVGGKIYKRQNVKVSYVPEPSVEYAKKLFEVHEIDCKIETIDAEIETRAESGKEIIVSFDNREDVERLTKSGYILAGIIPNRGLMFYSFDEHGIEILKNDIAKSPSQELKESFKYFSEYLVKVR